jgi:hypothetical protein
MIRTEVLREWSGELALAVVAARPGAIEHVDSLVTMKPNLGTRASISFEFYLSSLYVVCEAWRRFKLSDPEIDALLADDRRVAQLKECRDKVFHPGSSDDPIKAFHPENRDTTDWAPKLHKAFLRYCRAHFAGFDASRREHIEGLLREEELSRAARRERTVAPKR